MGLVAFIADILETQVRKQKEINIIFVDFFPFWLFWNRFCNNWEILGFFWSEASSYYSWNLRSPNQKTKGDQQNFVRLFPICWFWNGFCNNWERLGFLGMRPVAMTADISEAQIRKKGNQQKFWRLFSNLVVLKWLVQYF